MLGVRLATRRGAFDEAVRMADALAQAPGVPQSDVIQADLAACEALIGAGRLREAEKRLEACEGALDPRRAPANWGEYPSDPRRGAENSRPARRRLPRLRAEREHASSCSASAIRPH